MSYSHWAGCSACVYEAHLVRVMVESCFPSDLLHGWSAYYWRWSMEVSSVPCIWTLQFSASEPCQCQLHTLRCSEAGCVCVVMVTFYVSQAVLLSSPRGWVCWAASACVSGSKSPGALHKPSSFLFGGRVPRHLEHHRSCQSSRTGEKMGTGHSLQSRALHQGRTMVRGCSNVPAPSVWLTSCSPGHRALWTGIWISHKGNSSMYYFWISLPIRGMRVFPAYHLSSPLSMSSFPPLNLRILWCPNSHWNKRAFLCFRRPGPLPLTSLFSRFVLRAGVRTSAVRVQWPGALSLEGGWSCHPCRASVNMWRRHTTGGSAGWGEALSGWSIL